MIKNRLLTTSLSLACLLTSNFSNAQAGSLADELWASAGADIDFISTSSAEHDTEYYYPDGLIALPEETQYLIWTELDYGRLNLLERLSEKKYRLIKRIPISIGKEGIGKEIEGDKRTPVGVYRVTTYIAERDLTDNYGLGAYPINYPNSWDRLKQRTGYGIWLHGLPKGIDERPLLDSDGCVVVDNKSLTFLDDYILPGKTLMVLANEMNWVATDALDESDALIEAIDAWEQAWESGDASKYINNYHQDFSDFTRDLDAWTEYKTRVNGQKSYINVELSNITAVEYPGEDTVIVHFHQSYDSSNYKWEGWKELLWKKDSSGKWKILFEGNG